jgi:hypothetical protein
LNSAEVEEEHIQGEQSALRFIQTVDQDHVLTDIREKNSVKVVSHPAVGIDVIKNVVTVAPRDSCVTVQGAWGTTPSHYGKFLPIKEVPPETPGTPWNLEPRFSSDN